MIVVMATFENKDEAVRVGKGLLNEHMIACYNLWPVDSSYWWKDELVEQQEFVMLMKSKIRWFDDICDYIKENTGSETPEVIAFDSEKVDHKYQAWLNDEVK